MRKLFTTILKVWLISSVPFGGASSPALAFKTELPNVEPSNFSPFELLEAGLSTEKNVPVSVYYLGKGQYREALENVQDQSGTRGPWFESYLKDLVVVSDPLVKYESEHFELYVPAQQSFLRHFALPSLEKVHSTILKAFNHRPLGKIRVEIYPTKESFSKASTLTLETLERSGAIGICKFHRLMIMSPKTLPLGYRWLDALSHEYMHLIVNELTASRAELWLHEGTARYFETAYRSDPPLFLSPQQKTQLLAAREKGELVPFEKMSPSMVYLKDQAQVSLAFSQVSHAVSTMVGRKGTKGFVSFLKALRSNSFSKAFEENYQMTPKMFEENWISDLGKENWAKVKGAVPDDVFFSAVADEDLIGADAMDKVRLGDRMRKKGLYEGALVQYQRALKIEPDNAIILLKEARAYGALGIKDIAIKSLKHAVESNPNYGTPYIELGFVLDGGEASNYLMEALAINPFDYRIYHRLLSLHNSSISPLQRNYLQEAYDQLKP